jgi:hypothetical protein
MIAESFVVGLLSVSSVLDQFGSLALEPIELVCAQADVGSMSQYVNAVRPRMLGYRTRRMATYSD